MDLVDLIQSHRFLGSEFLLWLWHKSEVYEGRFNIGKREGCEVWFDDQITLEAFVVETEQSKLRGAAPTMTPEAREALRQGKLPTQAKMRVGHDGQEWAFVFKAPEFQMSGIKIPALLSRQDDEKFFERLYLIETLEDLMADLYAEFLGLRLRGVWSDAVVPMLRAWIVEEKATDVEAYRALLEANPAFVRRDRRIERARAARDAAPEVLEPAVDEVAVDMFGVPVSDELDVLAEPVAPSVPGTLTLSGDQLASVEEPVVEAGAEVEAVVPVIEPEIPVESSPV